MSGIEVASLVVGVLPLLFATADHFKDACRPFSRYCRLAPELKEFQRQLKTQKTIFRTECSLLLGRTTGPCCAVRMLEGIGSQVQAEGGELDQRFSVHIGEAGEACMAVLKQIEEKLTQMEEDEKELQDAIKSDTPLESIGDARWRRRVGKKLKYSFSKCTNLERNLSTLKELTQNFTTLSTQLERITDQHANTPSASAPKASREVDTYRVVQKASVQLYNALAEACTTHTEHLAHFRLQATHRQHYGKTMSHIRFSMAFKQMPLLDTATPVDPAWFEVESTIEGSIDFDSEAADGSRSSFKPSKRPHVVDKSVSVARSVQQRVQSCASLSASQDMSVVLPSLPANHCMQPNFCNQLMNSMRRPISQSEHCVGFLGETATCRHAVYLPTSPRPGGEHRTVSLASLVSSFGDSGTCNRLPQFERIRLGKLLATAVLQFHATPWLKGSWRSDDLLFFGVDRSEVIHDSSELPAPCLNVSVKGSQSADPHCLTTSRRTIAPNMQLFGLAMMLLELAYEAPLMSLRRPDDGDDEQDDSYTEFFVAKRLSHTASIQMGPRYSEVVRKCLACDFGQGDDLNQPALQEAFYKDVICELGSLEERFRELQLGVSTDTME